ELPLGGLVGGPVELEHGHPDPGGGLGGGGGGLGVQGAPDRGGGGVRGGGGDAGGGAGPAAGEDRVEGGGESHGSFASFNSVSRELLSTLAFFLSVSQRRCPRLRRVVIPVFKARVSR